MSIVLLSTVLLFCVIFVNHTRPRLTLGWILVIAIAVRLLTILWYRGITNYDIQSYQSIGAAAASGQSIYPSLAYYHHPYFPFLVYLEWASFLLSRIGVSQAILLKLLFSIIDVGVTWLVFRLGRKSQAALLYAINPLSILMITIHGQFDSIPLFFLLLAILNLKSRNMISALWYSVAIATKTWPILLFVPFVAALRNKWVSLLIPVVPAVLVVLYAFLFRTPVLEILRPVIAYRGVYGYWSISALFSYIIDIGSLLEFLFKPVSNMMLIVFFLYSSRITSNNFLQLCTHLIMVFYATSMTMGGQWLLWITPFLLITKPRYWMVFLALSTYMIAVAQVSFLPCSFCPSVRVVSEISKGIGILLWVTTVVMAIDGHLQISRQEATETG